MLLLYMNSTSLSSLYSLWLLLDPYLHNKAHNTNLISSIK